MSLFSFLQGPPGPVGPQGPAGATGATGATGPQGVPGSTVQYKVFNHEVIIATAGNHVDTFAIPSGWYAVSVGYTWLDDTGQVSNGFEQTLSVPASYTGGPASWTYGGNFATSGSLEIDIICISGIAAVPSSSF